MIDWLKKFINNYKRVFSTIDSPFTFLIIPWKMWFPIRNFLIEGEKQTITLPLPCFDFYWNDVLFLKCCWFKKYIKIKVCVSSVHRIFTQKTWAASRYFIFLQTSDGPWCSFWSALVFGQNLHPWGEFQGHFVIEESQRLTLTKGSEVCSALYVL